MSYSLDITPAVLDDIEEAARWHEGEEEGLGLDFTCSDLQAIEALALNPLIFRLRDRRRNVRWLITPRFPYRVVDRIRDERITVFAVVHAARHDRHWREHK